MSTYVESTINTSKNSPLEAGKTFDPGKGEDVLPYSEILLTIESDQNSATNGVEIQFRDDGYSNFITSSSFTYTAGTIFSQRVNVYGRYYKVIYTNGGVNQTRFALTSFLK